jgi:hypothetical protein
MSQTTYNTEFAQAFPGLIADAADPKDILSRANEESANVPFGLAVVPGTDGAEQFLLPSATGQVCLGVLAHRHQREDVEADGLNEGEVGDVLKRGRIWVVTEEAVAVDSPVFFRHTAPGVEQVGAFRTDADTANADEITSARWVAATSAAGIAQLDISLP